MSVDGMVGNSTVSWETARAANLANWEDRVPIHKHGYNLQAFVDDPEYLSLVARDDLVAMEPYLPGGSLRGLALAHLQCHIGSDTVSFARAGAQVTGVDFSPSALAVADELARSIGIADATWVETDVLDAAAAVNALPDGAIKQFDVVYTSIGTITWLHDLDKWAQQIAGLLKPGGLFFYRDAHPMMFTLDEYADDWQVRHRYFEDDGNAQVWDDAETYAGEGEITNTIQYEYPHSIAEIVNSLIGAGLRIERLEEGKSLPWQFSPKMVNLHDGLFGADGNWAWPADFRDKCPVTLTVIARKP